MESITVNIENPKVVEKVIYLLEELKEDGVEIVSKEDLDDLKLLKISRSEESMPFEEYLKNES